MKFMLQFIDQTMWNDWNIEWYRKDLMINKRKRVKKYKKIKQNKYDKETVKRNHRRR